MPVGNHQRSTSSAAAPGGRTLSRRRRTGRRTTVGIAVPLALLALSALASLLIGSGEVGPVRSWREVSGGSGDPEAAFAVWHLRRPRTLVAVTVGAALGTAGAVLQAAARNPLAEPGLLGVSAGASTGVVLVIALGGSVATLGPYAAVLGALLGCLAAVGAARLRGVGDDPLRLVLAGAALSGLLGSLTSVLLLMDSRTADEVRFWTVGGVAGRDLGVLADVAPALLLGGLLLLLVARPLSAMALGERVAAGLGHRPRRTRLTAVVAVALLVGGATAIAGPIGFVGLVVPFAARALVGPDLRRVLVPSLLLGPVVVLAADVVSRLLVRPYEMPLGVVTALIGAPVLVAVVRSRRVPTL
ncbi:iron ABC transporter permease [Streptomyces caniscabiei]|uniref:FecCD family ABC transporter permease n=1 Tax=Streptomyces caniscabiei TaxID=2746961 RepID=UPI0023DC24D7|nr:iron ABC transporter permease [Streptomyces caniscabiei]MDX3514371.1 iron ABC transporter permease [Streptomyces caniscabiei]MDX3716603.1 iron ABC transporter permease [Streptomyces caniscabiei]WEO22491.1 iron ABC transporter permease [Streptomyces caniscabiei]